MVRTPSDCCEQGELVYDICFKTKTYLCTHKVPAITYGGPKVHPEQPSSESVKLAESLILVEFIADLHPTSTILPKDPVQRAKARFFVDAVATKLFPAMYSASRGGSLEEMFKEIEAIQDLLSEGKYAMGDDFTIADISVAPFFGRMNISLEDGYMGEEGKKGYERLKGEKKYEKIWKYIENVTGRESFKDTFDEVSVFM
jgi:glutathione S-transferase